MSILIPGMEMQTSCYECPCNKDDGFGFFTCGVTKSECDFIGLPSDCPLVPVPKHGRLIDADGEIELNVKLMPNGKCDITLISPTIIPADKEGEG